MMGKKIKLFILCVCLYMYIYSPPVTFLPFGLIQFLVPISYIYILNKNVAKFLYLFKTEIWLIFIITTYSMFRAFFSGDPTFFYDNLQLLIGVLPITFFITEFVIVISQNDISGAENILINNFINVSFFASLITLFLILNPEAADIMRNKILRSGDISYDSMYRSFGFASSLVYSYAIVQGIAVAFLLFKLKKISFVQALFNLLIIISIVISILYNARTGFFPIFAALIYLLFTRGNVKLYLFIVIFLLAFNYILFDSSYASFFSENLNWSLKFFTETGDFISQKGGNQITYHALLSDMLFLPDNTSDLLFGVGYDIFTKGMHTSDVGYVRDIFFGGLTYLFLLFSLIFYMFKRMFLISKYRWYSFIFIVTTIICEIKGLFISDHSAFRLFLLFYISFIYFKKIGEKSDKFKLIYKP